MAHSSNSSYANPFASLGAGGQQNPYSGPFASLWAMANSPRQVGPNPYQLAPMTQDPGQPPPGMNSSPLAYMLMERYLSPHTPVSLSSFFAPSASQGSPMSTYMTAMGLGSMGY